MAMPTSVKCGWDYMQGHIYETPTAKPGTEAKASVLSLTSSSRHSCEKDTVIIHYIVTDQRGQT